MAINAGGGFDWRVLLSALSSLAPTLAASRASMRGQDELLTGRANIQRAQATADNRIGDEIMAARSSTPEPERAAAAADYTRAVRQARAGGNASLPSGLGGREHQGNLNASSSRVAGEGNVLAENFARIDAPIRQRERERFSVNRAAGDVQRELGRATSADYVARMRAQNAQRISPWIVLLSQLGSRIANNYQRQDEKTPVEVEVDNDPLAIARRNPRPSPYGR